MTTARDVADVFESIAPLDSGISTDQLGFVHGSPDRSVSGVGCTWCVHARSIATCARRGLDMIICHEGIWLGAQQSEWYPVPDASRQFSNQLRRRLLDRHQFAVYRSHSNWDALRTYGVADRAVSVLGIDGLREVGRERFFSVQQLPEPTTVRQLEQVVRRGLGFDATRLFGQADKPIERFAFLIGGFGGNQKHMPQVAMEMGAQAIIIGEMSEFIVIACMEMGLPVIETLHSVSEIPAIRSQAQLLADRLPQLRVEYVPSGAMSYMGCG